MKTCIRIPASSANLGPGFDCFGLAWQLWDTISFERREGELRITGCEERFQNKDNLAWRALCRTLEICGESGGEAMEICFEQSQIPVARGLGSSAALIVGGVLAADRLWELGLSEAELLRIASDIEGHPDNVAPALLGGFTVAFPEDGKILYRSLPLSPELCFLLLIPPGELSTHSARAVLPKQVPLSHAVYALSHASLLPKALEEGDPELLRYCLRDKLHQPYRFPLIPEAERVRSIAEDADVALCISGAGSALLAVSRGREQLAAMQNAVREELPGLRTELLSTDREGAKVIAPEK